MEVAYYQLHVAWSHWSIQRCINIIPWKREWTSAVKHSPANILEILQEKCTSLSNRIICQLKRKPNSVQLGKYTHRENS